MKITSLKSLFLFSLFLTLISCEPSSKNENSSLVNQGEDFLKTRLKDPSSYQKISCEIIDTVRMSEFTQGLLIIYDGASLDSAKNVIADLKANPDKDTIKYISIKCMYRAKNSFGALVINKTIINYFMEPDPSGEQFFIYLNEEEK
jgi:hypothetical protein